ncbi:phage head completion protein [Myroides odoratus]|uniref:Bacteriophage head-tail adaptor n=1 Tax=Myroides odoratus TaxID=256 RepID=A0A378RNJ2_MYROD|nr:head-tail adaptor protein [Myroides odoratus]QQU04028.1 head-tail adaptor protein [Myroides odoratus]STZ28586.1 Bacteriophage head-tail adaptor [Myroides odoratus]
MAIRKPYIGQMDRRINIHRVVIQKDKVGQEKTVREEFSKTYAKLENDYGSREVDMAVMNETTRVYVIRWRKEIEQEGIKMLIEDQGVFFTILSVSPLGRRSHLILKCVNEQ